MLAKMGIDPDAPSEEEVEWAISNAKKIVRQIYGAVGDPKGKVIVAETVPSGCAFVVHLSFSSRINYCTSLRRNADGSAFSGGQYPVLNCSNPPRRSDVDQLRRFNAAVFK